MSHITLRRAAEQARSALKGWANHGLWAWPESALQTCKQNTEEALAALDAALAEPEKATMPTQYGWLCPACGRGNAPLAQTCPCRGWPTMQITCGPATMTGGT